MTAKRNRSFGNSRSEASSQSRHGSWRLAVFAFLSVGGILMWVSVWPRTQHADSGDPRATVSPANDLDVSLASLPADDTRARAERIRAEALELDRQFMRNRRDRLDREYFAEKTDHRDARNHWQQQVATLEQQFDDASQDRDAIGDFIVTTPAGTDGPGVPVYSAVGEDPFAELRSQALQRLEEDAPAPY